MPLANINPTTTQAWKKLTEHFERTKDDHLRELFKNDPGRAEAFQLEWEDFYLDYSKNKIDAGIMEGLWTLPRK